MQLKNTNLMDREEMLRQLANQTLSQFNIENLTSSEPEDQQEEEWEGIQSQESGLSDEDDSCFSLAGSDEDFDDPEDLHHSLNHHQLDHDSQREPEPELIVFQDPSRPVKEESSLSQPDRKSFMASMLKKQINNQPAGSSSTSNRKRNSSSKDDDEAKLEHLDRSLTNLISHLSGPTKKGRTVGLETILSTTLPPITKEKNPQRHPRNIKTGMARAELQRSLAADKEALLNGTVRATNAKTLSKKQKRIHDGADARDRRLRRQRTDRLLGSSKGPGGMIKISNREIQLQSNRSKYRAKK